MFLDDRQRSDLKFKVLPGLPYTTRLVVVVGLWVSGLVVQGAGGIWPGAILIFAGTILALIRGYSNEPKVRPRSGGKRWENATLDQFRRIGEIDEEARRWDRKALIDATNVWGFLVFLLLLVAVGGVGLLVLETTSGDARLSTIFLVDAAALFLPFWLTGLRRLYQRTELMIRVRALETIVDHIEKSKARGLMPAPMLELQKTERGDLPLDVKLMVRFEDAPDDFMGVQVQVSLNDVQGTKYPYLYCVILAKPGFHLHRWDTKVDGGRPKILTERNRTEEVELIVVRQKTTRKSGYHTKPAAQRRVFDAAVAIARRNLPSRS